MKIAIAQINTRTADIKGNTAKILEFASRARSLDAELVLFPELALPGYPPHDYLERPAFLDACERAMAEIAATTDERMGILLGNVVRNPETTGKAVFNSACLLAEGRLAGMQHKSLLPSYDVFDESRYFEPAHAHRPLLFHGRRLGVSVCEDIWNDKAVSERLLYHTNPIDDLVAQGAEVLINISASPFSVGRNRVRHALLASTTKRYRLPLFYANLVGGNDSLIFPGKSVVFRADGNISHQCAPFAEDLVVLDSDSLAVCAPPVLGDVEDLHEGLVLGIRDYAHKCGFRSAVIGLSGGIDSSVVACLAVSALGHEQVLGVSMPSVYSSRGSVDDAVLLARNLGIRLLTIPIEKARNLFDEMLAEAFADTKPGVTEENIQARIRGIIIMALSNKFGHLPLTTGNKSELAMGYTTLYGDMCGGLTVIGDVPKTLVYLLAAHINRRGEIIPGPVLTKPPSAELRPNQKDQDSLPPYEVLDRILKLYIEEHREEQDIVAAGYDPRLVHDVLRRVDRAEYKRRQAAPVLRVTAKAFGVGRRLPIAQGWR